MEGEWEVVVRPRRAKAKAHARRQAHRETQHDAFCPSAADPSCTGAEEDERRMRGRLARSMERVRTSAFFRKLVEQLHDLQILENLLARASTSPSRARLPEAVLEHGFAAALNLADHEASTFQFSDGSLIVEERGTGMQSLATVELVVLGVGSILDSEVSRCQMSLALLLKERFPCIGEVLVYDPVLSPVECAFLTDLGCTPIVRDEKGRRRAHLPTLFYMPHCGASLYNNLLEANRDPWCLGWISILGNSFQRYQDSWSLFPKPKHARPDCLLGMQQHVTEHPVNAAAFPCVSAFNDMSWHLFPAEKIK